MKLPWENRSRLAKAAIICTIGFLLSTGLCGLNLAFTHNALDSDFVFFAGIIELLAMGVFALGFLIVVITALVKFAANSFKPKQGDTQ
jgi:hypothetical protein